jgi:hypothetical protein
VQILIILLFLVLAILFFAQKQEKIVPVKAMYFWESKPYNLCFESEEFLIQNEVEKIYLKFFEVEKNEALVIFPSAKTNLKLPSKLASIAIIPTVYIRNEVFKNSSKQELNEFADNLLHLIEKKYNDNFSNLSRSYQEIQMDCDWTISTQENYFYFLKKLKEHSKITISATLRLYPYKFPDKMGVLPVDRAMLMCYNLLPPLDAGNKNSILDLEELSKYLVGAQTYPLPLDLALPIYSSALVYKNDQFAGIHYLGKSDLTTSLQEIKSPFYSSTKDTLLNELFMRVGDKVKLEKIDLTLLENALKIIQKNISFEEGTTISLFQLNSLGEHRFNHEEITSLYSTFQP